MRVETLRLNYYQSSWHYIDVDFDDNDYIQDANTMYLNFSLPYYIEFVRGAYIDYKIKDTDTPIRYYLLGNSQPKKINSENFKFSLTLNTIEGKLSDWILKNTIDNRIKFSLTARPQEFLQLIVDNANLRDSGWSIGEYITATEKLCSFSSNNLTDALQLIADAFDTEWYVINKTIYLKKREFNYSNPLTLSYGSGYGIKPIIERKDYNKKRKISKLWVQGGDKNLNTSSSSYGNKYLLLPKGQSIWYNGIDFVSTSGIGDARSFRTDSNGLYVYRTGDDVEGTFDASNIYPKRVGTISSFNISANASDERNPFYNIYDNSIPDSLDYNHYLLAGEKMTIVFQSGRLAGKTFDVSKYIHSSRCFLLVSYSEDGQTYPNSVFEPAAGDTYAVFGCTMPNEYICDNTTQTGASWEMFKEAVKYMWDEEVMQCIFTLPIDEIWLRRTQNQINIGDFINFVDDELSPNGLKIRVTNIKRNLRNPYKIEITLSNVRVVGGLLNRFNRYETFEEITRHELNETSSTFRRDVGMVDRRIGDLSLDEFGNERNIGNILGEVPVSHKVFGSTKSLEKTLKSTKQNLIPDIAFTSTKGYRLNNIGIKIEDETYELSSFIPVVAGAKYLLSCYFGNGASVVGYDDAEGNNGEGVITDILLVGENTLYQDYELIIPSGTKFVRICSQFAQQEIEFSRSIKADDMQELGSITASNNPLPSVETPLPSLLKSMASNIKYASGKIEDLQNKPLPIPIISGERSKTIQHNLGYKPTIQVIDDNGEERYVTKQHIDNNSIHLSWIGSFIGNIILE